MKEYGLGLSGGERSFSNYLFYYCNVAINGMSILYVG